MGAARETAQTAPRGPYRDIVVQRLAIQPLILRSDVQEVDLAARHHDADQGPVFGSCSLKKVAQGHELWTSSPSSPQLSWGGSPQASSPEQGPNHRMG